MKPRLKVVLALAAGSFARSAAAYEARVDASADLQLYAVTSPFGAPVLQRQRYTHTLGLAVYGIHGSGEPDTPYLSFRSRLRLDADFGIEESELNPDSDGRFVPNLERAPVDLMYAYLEGTGYAGGVLGFRLGRQYVIDPLGFWSFDGALVSLTLPIALELSAYGGVEQRVGLPLLSTQRFEADGVYRGDRAELELNQRPEFLSASELAPAYGFMIESVPLRWLSARLSYRRVTQSDRVNVSPFADAAGGFIVIDGARISSERAGYAMRAEEPDLGGVRGQIVYDVYNQVWSEHALGLDFYANEGLTIGADYHYFLPTFDADSIFNWFTHSGATTLVGRSEVTFSERIDAGVSGGLRSYRTEGEPATFAVAPDRQQTDTLLDYLGSLRGRYRWSDGSVVLDALGEAGQRGHRVGADLTTRQALDGGFYDTLVILSLYNFRDGLRPQRQATSFTYVLGAALHPGGSFFSRGRLGFTWEHTVNRLVGQRFRVLATLDLSLLTPVLQ